MGHGIKTGIDRNVSQLIAVARVLCILSVIYVHSPPYTHVLPTTVWSQETVIWVFREGIGRSSVPLLSIVSGFLAMTFYGKLSWGGNIRKKAASLLVPMFLWNTIALLKTFVEIGHIDIGMLADAPDRIFAITDFPQITLFYFLRDTFVCMVLLPALIFMVTRLPKLSVAMLFLNATFDFDGILFLNSAIPLFFLFGLILKHRPAIMDGLHRQLALLSLLSLVGLGAIVFLPIFVPSVAEASASLDHELVVVMQRLFGSVLFWWVCVQLVKTRFHARVRCYEPLIFLVFCSHPLVLGAAWKVVNVAGLEDAPYVGIAFFLVSPLIAVVGAYAIARILDLTAPTALKLLMGMRAPGRAELKAMVGSLGERAERHRAA